MTALHLVRTRIDRMELARYAAETGVLDDDLGYALHLALRRRFGSTAPQPFRLLNPEAARPLLLGYTTEPPTAPAAATPDPTGDWSVLPAIFPEALDARPMPPEWPSGLSLRFDLRVRPVRRYGTRARAARGHGAGERDAFQVAWDNPGDAPPGREQVYSDWLSERLLPAARLDTAQMTGFRRVRVLRAQPGKAARGHGGRGIEGPDALLTGILTVLDGAAFTEMLARGVGRHVAFGYGMLLLTPGSA